MNLNSNLLKNGKFVIYISDLNKNNDILYIYYLFEYKKSNFL